MTRWTTNAVYTLAIWSDAPANTAGSSYSHPDQLLWTQTYSSGQYTLCPYTNQFESFYDGDSALTGVLTQLGSSSNLFYLCFDASPTNTFYQTGTPAAPTNYWLSVTVQSFAARPLLKLLRLEVLGDGLQRRCGFCF